MWILCLYCDLAVILYCSNRGDHSEFHGQLWKLPSCCKFAYRTVTIKEQNWGWGCCLLWYNCVLILMFLSHSKTGMLLSDAVMTLAIAESFVITLKEIITCCSVHVMYLIDFVANTYYNQCNGYNTILLYSEVSRPVCILAGPMVLCRKFYQIPFLFHYMWICLILIPHIHLIITISASLSAISNALLILHTFICNGCRYKGLMDLRQFLHWVLDALKFLPD